MDVSPQDFKIVCENVSQLADCERKRGTDYTDAFEIHTRCFKPGVHYEALVIEVEGQKVTPTFSCTVWSMKSTGSSFPVALECRLSLQAIQLKRLVTFSRKLHYGLPIGGQRTTREIDLRIARLFDLLKVKKGIVGPAPSEKGNGSDESLQESIPVVPHVLRHRAYGVCVIDSWRQEDNEFDPNSGGNEFVSENKFGLMGLLLKPLYDPTDLDRAADELVVPERGSYSFSENIFCNFTIRSGLIVYNKQKKTIIDEWPKDDEIYILEYLDVFRVLRTLWAKAVDVLVAFDSDFGPERNEDPSETFAKTKDLQVHMNWAELHHATMGSNIYKNLFKKGLAEFGITDAIDHTSRIERLVSARSSYESANRADQLQHTVATLTSMIITMTLAVVVVSAAGILVTIFTGDTERLATLGLLVLLGVAGGIGLQRRVKHHLFLMRTAMGSARNQKTTGSNGLSSSIGKRLSESKAQRLWLIMQFLFAVAVGVGFLVYIAHAAPLGWIFAASAMIAYVAGDASQHVFKRYSSFFDRTYLPLFLGSVILLPVVIILGAIGGAAENGILNIIASGKFTGSLTVEALTLLLPILLAIDIFLLLKKSWGVYPGKGAWGQAALNKPVQN